MCLVDGDKVCNSRSGLIASRMSFSQRDVIYIVHVLFMPDKCESESDHLTFKGAPVHTRSTRASFSEGYKSTPVKDIIDKKL